METNTKQTGRQPDFIAKCVRMRKTKDGTEKEIWTDVGVAFLNSRTETISIRLNALPLGDMVLMKPRPKEDKQKTFNPFGGGQ
jgi:hypothetical protein